MRLHNALVAMAALLATFNAVPTSARADVGPLPAGSSAATEMRWLDTELFSVEIPASWKELGEEELKANRAHAERVAKEIFPPDVVPDSPQERVQWFNAFESDDQSTLLLLAISEIPLQTGAGRPYVESKVLGYADWQRAQETVDKVRVGELTELNGMPAVEVNFDLRSGATMYTVNLWTSVYRDRVGTIVAIAEADALASVREMLLTLLATIKPSEAVAEGLRRGGFRNWVREKLWRFEGAEPTEAMVLRVIVVLATFSVCFALSLRLIYEGILVWYRWHNMEDRVIEAARRAARDALRLGTFYSERLTLSCALFSMSVTTAAVVWLARP